MTAPLLALNGIQAVSVRLLMPWLGVWIADVDVELDASGAASSGPATLTIGSSTLVGTIDPRGSGRFGAAARLRVVGGGGGWDKTLPARHWHNDAGLTSTVVLSSTATEAGETVREPSGASVMGVDFVRSAGPASRVLAGFDWYVELGGQTVVGARPRAALDAGVDILAWNPLLAVAELAADTLVLPGTELTDTRFDGTRTVRDVEQTFTKDGARVRAWCGDSSISRLSSALASLVQEKAGIALLRTYRYRVVLQDGDGRLELQIVKSAAGVPDIVPISAWPGAPGITSKPELGSIVLVDFVEGDSTIPVVRSYGDGTPIELDLDALAVKIGASAASVAIGAAPAPLALAAPVVAGFTAVTALAAALAAATSGAAGVFGAYVGPAASAFSGFASAMSSIAATTPTTVVKGT